MFVSLIIHPLHALIYPRKSVTFGIYKGWTGYAAKSGHFSAIRYPAGYWILKKRISGFQISGRISGKPDINKTFLLLFEDLRCFNYLSNSVEQRTDIEISGIRPDIRYPAPTGYPAGYPAGYRIFQCLFVVRQSYSNN